MDGAWPNRVGDAWDEGDLRKPWGGRREPDEVLPHPVTHAAAEEDLRPPAATLSSSSNNAVAAAAAAAAAARSSRYRILT